MKLPPEHRSLLDDVMAEGSSSELRETLREETLRLARRRRGFLRWRRAGAVALVLGVAGLAVWRSEPGVPAPASIARTDYALIRTQPLVDARKAAGARSRDVQVISSAAGGVVVFSTREVERGYRIIDDDELLAIVAPRGGALVRLGGSHQELIFENPADGDGFRIQ